MITKTDLLKMKHYLDNKEKYKLTKEEIRHFEEKLKNKNLVIAVLLVMVLMILTSILMFHGIDLLTGKCVNNPHCINGMVK